MTAVKDPSIGQPVWDAYRALLREDKLTEHVCVLWYAGSTLASARAALASIEARPKPPQSLGDGRLLSCGAKIFMDGSGGARTAWVYARMAQEFHGASITAISAIHRPTPRCIARWSACFIRRACTSALTRSAIAPSTGWWTPTPRYSRETPTFGLRHSIIHANIPSDHAIETMAALEKRYDAGYPEAQAPFMWWIGDTYAGNFGPERSLRLVPLNTFARNGIRWGGGSDYSVTPLAARYGLWASVAEKRPKAPMAHIRSAPPNRSTFARHCAPTRCGAPGNSFLKTG